MRFTTASGSTYELTDIQDASINDKYPLTSAWLIRDGVPLVHIYSGEAMGTLAAQRITYHQPPEVGQPFRYFTETHGGVVSTPVAAIENEVAA